MSQQQEIKQTWPCQPHVDIDWGTSGDWGLTYYKLKYKWARDTQRYYFYTSENENFKKNAVNAYNFSTYCMYFLICIICSIVFLSLPCWHIIGIIKIYLHSHLHFSFAFPMTEMVQELEILTFERQGPSKDIWHVCLIPWFWWTSDTRCQGMGLFPDTQNCGCACAGNAGNVFPVTAGKRSRHASRHVCHARAVMHAGIAN